MDLSEIIEEFLTHKLKQAAFVLEKPSDLVELTAAGLEIESLSMSKVPWRKSAAFSTVFCMHFRQKDWYARIGEVY